MKKFSVKDFIKYNSPCFNCGELVNFKIVSNIQGEEYILPVPEVRGNIITIHLKHKYKSSISLSINGKTNKFSVSNLSDFKKYIEVLPLRLNTTCNKCHIHVSSDLLSFNYEKGFIYLTELNYEIVYVHTKNIKYYLTSNFKINESRLIVDKLDEGNKIIGRYETVLPLLPMYKFKNKENFLSKIGIYLVFS